MARIKQYLIQFLLLLGVSHCAAQKIFFEEINSATGLPSDYVNCVFRDSRGYLWVGTDKGACRYDGHQFQYFNRDNGLTSNFVYCISEDNQQNIWFGTFEGGLCRYDGSRIVPVPLDSPEFRTIFHMYFNRDGSLLLISGNFHLFYLRDRSFKAKKIYNQTCYEIYPYAEGKYFLNAGTKMINSLEEVNDQFVVHTLWKAKSDRESIISNLPNGHFVVRNGPVVDIYAIDGNDIRLERKFVLPPDFYGETLWSYYSKENELWLSTNNATAYQNVEGQTEFFTAENGLGGTNFIRHFYEDGERTLYIGTYGGGVKIWTQQYIREFPVDGKVNSISISNRATYLTTTRGLYQFDSAGKCVELSGLRADRYTSCYQAPNGRLFLGTYSGFLTFPSRSFLHKISASMTKNYETMMWSGASGFLSTTPGKMLVSTYGEGIMRYEIKGNQSKALNLIDTIKKPRMAESIKPLLNGYAVLSYNTGLLVGSSQIEPRNLSKSDGLLSNSVYSVFQENKDEIWIGSLNGLNLSDGLKVIKTYSYPEGFIGTKVLCIFRDSLRRFWVLSDKYLHLLEGGRLRPIRSHVILYGNNTINRAEFDTSKQLLFLGQTNSFLVVEISKIKPDSVISKPEQSMLVDGRVIPPSKGKIEINSSDQVEFSISYPFNPLAKHSDLYYRLKGYDPEWKLLDPNEKIIYPKLPAGQYEMVCRVVNPDFYSSGELRLEKFEVLPPFWQRFWFLISCFILLGTSVFFGVHYYSSKKYKREISRMQQQQHLQLERERIARELHDNVGSQLTYLINKIEDEDDSADHKERARDLGKFARQTMRELRETIWALHKKEIPPDELGTKVQQLLRFYEYNGCKIESEWRCKYDGSKPLNSLEALNIYRIVQESVNNAIKHSNASIIKVSADFEKDKYLLSIEDDGIGFNGDSWDKGYGLSNMKKRSEEMNGEFKISSLPGKGTRIRVTIYPNGKN